MYQTQLSFDNKSIQVYSLNTLIVGSGAAGFNAANRLYSLGQKDIAIITEGVNMGTSRNTGSDKQTYYKLTLCGDHPDSILDMAKTLFQGGAMDGDIALTEAALSPQCFYQLVDIGVPFPYNRYGEYVGYKTDHDPRQRATSIGPLTSKRMTEKLEEQVRMKGIPILDGYQAISILTDDSKEKTVGLLALNLNKLKNPDERYALFNCTNIIYATGGPAGMYKDSAYPDSQTGATGIAFEAGVKGKNLTESQYGIASTKFRWNLSGTFQQVLPRYISTNEQGEDEKEFLQEYFHDPGKMMDAIFLKGYQWPFDPRKVVDYGSSLIDILVYQETIIKGRRVFLDYTKNLSYGSKEGKLDFNLLGEESYRYLKNSRALFGTPIERLAYMNQPAIDLYKEHNIDLSKEYLEVAVCAQHNNGGLEGNVWWESNIKHFFPAGEVNGSHGIYRPGGSALNSGQVGSTRAAQFIAARYSNEPLPVEEFIQVIKEQMGRKMALEKRFLSQYFDESNVKDIRRSIGERMTKYGAHIRSYEGSKTGLEETKEVLETLGEQTRLSTIYELPYAYQNYDLLVTQYVYFCAIKNYIEKQGKSRGSYLIQDPEGQIPVEGLPENFRFLMDDGRMANIIQETKYLDGKIHVEWRTVRFIPEEDNWFESIWSKYRKGEIIQ